MGIETRTFWHITLYDPKDLNKDESERDIILEGDYRTKKDAHKAVMEKLEGTGHSISYSYLYLMGGESYKERDSPKWRMLKVKKVKKDVKVIRKTGYTYEIL